MNDYLKMRQRQRRNKCSGGDDLLTIAIVIALIFGAYSLFQTRAENKQKRADFLQECQNDGKKPYECQVMYGQMKGGVK